MGAPIPANPHHLAAALAPDGAATRLALLQSLASRDKAQAESAARTLKKIAQADPALLYDLRKPLLNAAFAATEVRVQWNLTVTLGLLPLRGRDRALAIDLFYRRLQDASGLNRTFALQALVDFAAADPAEQARLQPILRDFEANGTPAMRARARRLLAQR